MPRPLKIAQSGHPAARHNSICYDNPSGPVATLLPERVMVGVVGGLELQVHEVACAGGRGEEEDLHGCVVQGDEVREEIHVPGDEHQRKQDLGPA